jgi:hypothetical protein
VHISYNATFPPDTTASKLIISTLIFPFGYNATFPPDTTATLYHLPEVENFPPRYNATFPPDTIATTYFQQCWK